MLNTPTTKLNNVSNLNIYYSCYFYNKNQTNVLFDVLFCNELYLYTINEIINIVPIIKNTTMHLSMCGVTKSSNDFL